MEQSSEQLFYPAQTNTALYCQLHAAGHGTENLLRVQQAYRVCCKLFNGRYRKTERPFVCHAVGAASSVAQFDQRIELILAGMLHAAYDSGAFPDGRTGASPSHRRWLAGQVGPEIDRFVAAYNSFDFDTGKPEKLVETDVTDDQRDMLLIALSHEVDDLADGGLIFAPKYGRCIATRAAACAALARRINQPQLAQTLEQHALRYKDVAWTAALEVPKLHGFRIAPNLQSYFRLRRDNYRKGPVEVF